MERFDVVVLGTGAAGLTAAIAAHESGASVAVFEKADLVGGTTAWSGGQVWIPNNPHMAEVGVADSRDNAFGATFHVEDVSRFEYANLPCWLVFDQTYVDTYGFRVTAGGVGGEPPSWVPRGENAAELADVLGIDADALEATIERWNELCLAGHDPDFGRGNSAFDCWWGDPHRKGRRDATLGPLTRGPFYAYQIHSGTLGTKGGPRVDPSARVLDLSGSPIPGLYAAGNVMGSPFGMTYGGPGGTLGPAMVFGYLAGQHAAGR